MTLDEAIKHCLEVAERNETSVITYKNCKEFKTNMYEKLTAEKAESDCRECAADHRQLAEWLTDYKKLRSIVDACNILAVDAFAVEKLCKELKEAKRLLKAAVEDFKVIGKVLDADCDILINCEECPLQSGHYNCRSWNHQDEALALIGEDINVPATADDIIVGSRLDGWISCEERLPEDNRPVLCYVRDITGEGSGYIIGSCEHSEFWFLKISGNKCFSFPYMRIKVTHWMPLPEPPKIGGADHENTV